MATRRPYARAAVWALALVLSGAAEGRAFPWWRDAISSRWAPAPPAFGGGEAPWADAEEASEPQLLLRALNDGASVYLRLTADGADGRALLAGAYRQDVTLWFLAPDGKTKDWGLRLPFSDLGPVSPAQPLPGEPAIPPAVAPELVSSVGVAASTSALPADVLVSISVPRKDPVVEIAIPLARLKPKDGKTVLVDLVSAPVSDETRSQVRPPKRAGRGQAGDGSSGEGGGWSAEGSSQGGGRFPSGGGRGMGRGGGRRRGGSAGPRGPVFPDPLDLRLSLRLARRPDGTR